MTRRNGAFLLRLVKLSAAFISFPLLMGAKGSGCSAGGDVPVGQDDDPMNATCGAGACNGLERTLDARVCSDGSSVERSVCAKSASGTCFWDFPACPEDKPCSQAECANVAADTDAKACPGGVTLSRTECTRSPSGQCFLDFPACPAVDAGPAQCTLADCAGKPVPEDARVCSDGTSLGRTVCAKNARGACFWDFPACPAPATSDASDCGCVPDMSWGYDGGFVAYVDRTSVTECKRYRHFRYQGAALPPPISCERTLVGCPSGLIGGRDIVTAMGHRDVEEAIKAAPVLYGHDNRPADGAVFRIAIGGAVIEVGDVCQLSAECKPIPSGIQSLVNLLKAIDEQELRFEPCASTFPKP